jgi:hypothetical protein
MKEMLPTGLGEPDLSLAGLRIWISGRQFPDANDYWDGNWLLVTASCVSAGAQVVTQGPILHLSELRHWLNGLKDLLQAVEGEAELPCMEPNLWATVRLGKTGSGSLAVSITPDPLKERHEFEIEIDQSYLPRLVRELEDILTRYPLKGDRT